MLGLHNHPAVVIVGYEKSALVQAGFAARDTRKVFRVPGFHRKRVRYGLSAPHTFFSACGSLVVLTSLMGTDSALIADIFIFNSNVWETNI
jgi:hypothetical protein